MLIGYARVSKSDGSQTTNLQVDALIEAGVKKENIYQDYMSGKNDDRPELTNCLKALRPGDILVVWKLDRLGRNLCHLINTIQDLNERNIGFKVLSGQGAAIDTTSASGKLMFGIFAALAEFERELIRERTKAGLQAARMRGKKGGRPTVMTRAKLKIIKSAMIDKNVNIAQLCRELKISKQTLYRYVSPDGELRPDGEKLLD